MPSKPARERSVLGKLRRYLRGDRFMVDSRPPDGEPSPAAVATAPPAPKKD